MRFTENCSIISAAVGPEDIPLITVMNDGLAEERVQHIVPIIRENGNWLGLEADKVAPFLSAGIAPLGNDPYAFAVVGWAGQVLVTHKRQSQREVILRGEEYTSIIRRVAAISGRPYAVGMRRQVYRRSDGGVWNSIDEGAAYEGEDSMIGFEAIDGFDSNEMYSAGISGDLWTARDGRWHSIKAPTGVHLHALICAPNGQVYVGGRFGVLIKGRGESWALVDLDTEETIWALQWFGDALYIFSDTCVYRLEGSEVTRIENDAVGGGGFHTACIGRNTMWCFASKRIVMYDGKNWTIDDCHLAEPIDSDLLGFFNGDVVDTGSEFLLAEEE